MRSVNVSAARAVFQDNFNLREELGASVSVWFRGEEVLNLAAGFRDRQRVEPWTAETAVLVWSATKGPAAACVLHCLQEHGIHLSSQVSSIWPGFAQAGKEGITFSQVLSHRAGLAALSTGVSVWNYDEVIRALETQEPLWPPGEAHGYHPRTFGFIADEIVRRLSNRMPLGEYWRQQFADPLRLDFWIGVPPELLQSGRIASVFQARRIGEMTPFQQALIRPRSLTARAFASPQGLPRAASMNADEARSFSFPAWGGVGTATGLAKFYAMLAAGGSWDGRTFFAPAVLASMSTTLSSGLDAVLQLPTAFAAGFMKDPVGDGAKKMRRLFGPSLAAFGHPGAGGSLAFADPRNGLAFAYIMNQMEPGVLPNAKSLLMVEALYGARS